MIDDEYNWARRCLCTPAGYDQSSYGHASTHHAPPAVGRFCERTIGRVQYRPNGMIVYGRIPCGCPRYLPIFLALVPGLSPLPRKTRWPLEPLTVTKRAQ